MFPGDIGSRDYSGFDRATWPQRTNQQHRREMAEILCCKTKGEKETLESKYGTRYSVLVELEYYDSIRMAVIDPMHNLFSGKILIVRFFKFLDGTPKPLHVTSSSLSYPVSVRLCFFCL